MPPASSPHASHRSSRSSFSTNASFRKVNPFSSLLQILNEILSGRSIFRWFFMTIRHNHRIIRSSADFPIHYVHDPSNGGLASAYNYALARAESEEREWLLLLDQDTSLTAEFISELVETSESLALPLRGGRHRSQVAGARQNRLSVDRLLRSDATSVPAICNQP